MLSCSVWFSAPSFWMGGGLERRCVGRVYGADGAVRPHGTIRIYAKLNLNWSMWCHVKAARNSALSNSTLTQD